MTAEAVFSYIMAYCEEMVLRILGYFDSRGLPVVYKQMMGSICFMLNDKMCCATHIDKASDQSLLMARVGEEVAERFLDEDYVLPMDFTGRPMKGFLFVEEVGLQSDLELYEWLDRCVAFNPQAKASVKKKK